MLRPPYKALLISVISWSLLIFHSQVVFAAATESKGTVTTDSKGVITSTKSINFDKVGDSDMLTSLTMIAGGYIAAMTVQVEKKSDGSVNEEQIQRLQDLRKSYEEAKNGPSIFEVISRRYLKSGYPKLLEEVAVEKNLKKPLFPKHFSKS